MPNPERRYALIALVVAAAAGILVFMPGWLGVDGMDGGYAISFVAAWIAISGLLIAWFFWRRAARLDELLNGQDLLVHWTYTPAEWQAYPGHYRSFSPWESNFRVLLRCGKLLLAWPEGDEEPLVPAGPAAFRVGEEPWLPERLRFGPIVDGQAWGADLSGGQYSRAFTP